MRRLTDAQRLDRFMEALGKKASRPTQLYFTGGATAVLHGWRPTTIDLDIKIVPESDELLRAIPGLKETLEINVELASPEHFIPELPGWSERSLFIRQVGQVSFYHFDPYAQALSKLERGHTLDLQDVQAMRAGGLIENAQLSRLFETIEPDLYRYPAIDPRAFRAALEAFLEES